MFNLGKRSLTTLRPECFIFGAGGFASEVAAELQYLRNSPRLVALCHNNDVAQTKSYNGIPIMHVENVDKNLPCANIAIGNPQTRQKIAEMLVKSGFSFMTIISSNVRVHPTVTIGEGSILCRSVVPTVDISIGKHSHINLLSTLGHGVHISDFVTISPGCLISGNVKIEDCVFIGTGAKILNGTVDEPLTIGADSVIAAGSVVTKSVPPRTMVAGVPAVIKKQW
jgi:sugar O-acyltransferase (sialic acid O-acetyltransferase NeuD family)